MIFEIVGMGMEWGQIIVSVSLFSKQFIVLLLLSFSVQCSFDIYCVQKDLHILQPNQCNQILPVNQSEQ